MSKKHKKEKEKQLLITKEREQKINELLQFSRKRFKHFDEVITSLYMEEDLSSFFADRRISKVHECFTKFSSKNRREREGLKNVFVYLQKYSVLMSGEDYIQVVFNMVLFKSNWKRDVFKWQPSSKRGEMQINELAFYLFCQYKVPEFLYKSFYEKTNMLFINWFIHIGTGKKARELENVPINFTQKMAHYFLLAPATFSIPEALRWAQVKGLGGDDKIAGRIAYSWIGTKPYEDEGFWETFMRLVINGGMFNYEKLTEIIDYVRDTKRANAGYNLKGRTLQSLMKQSDEWHKRTSHFKGNIVWKSCGIEGYRIEKKLEVLTLEELLDSGKLTMEGKTMKHCVASYVHYCVKGKTAIFSMRKYSMGILINTLATVEVNLSSLRIAQAKGKLNSKISEEAKRHLDVWAEKQGLSVNPYI